MNRKREKKEEDVIYLDKPIQIFGFVMSMMILFMVFQGCVEKVQETFLEKHSVSAENERVAVEQNEYDQEDVEKAEVNIERVEEEVGNEIGSELENVEDEILEEVLASRIMEVYHRDPKSQETPLELWQAELLAEEIVYQASRFSNVSPFLLMAIAETESNFHLYRKVEDGTKVIERNGEKEVVPSYSKGIYFVRDETSQWIWDMARIEQRYDVEYCPEKIIDPLSWGTYVAAYYLNWLYNRFDGDRVDVVAAYNVGPSIIDRSENQHLIHEYSYKVFGIKEVLVNEVRRELN